MDNPFGGQSAMNCGLTRDGKLRNVITHNVMGTNQKTGYFGIAGNAHMQCVP